MERERHGRRGHLLISVTLLVLITALIARELSQFRVLKKHLAPPCPPLSPSSPCSCRIGRSYARKRLGAQGFHMVGLTLLATSCH